MAITYIPREKDWIEKFTEGMAPYLQLAFQKKLEEAASEKKTKKIYEQAEQMGLRTKTPYQQAQTFGEGFVGEKGTIPVKPYSTKIPTQYQYALKQQPGMKTSFKIGANNIPEFGMETESPFDQEYKQSQIALNTAYADALKGGEQGVVQDLDVSSMLPEGENAEDYILKPTMRSVRGVPRLMNVPIKKPQVPTEQSKEITQLISNISDIKSNLSFLTENPEIKKFIGPGIVQRPGAIADILAQTGFAPKDFSTFKAKTDLSFQKYRKWVTGVQAGYPELQWIVVDYPKPTDTAEIYVSKALSAIDGMERNKQLFLDFLSANGYAVSKIRGLDSEQQPQQENIGQTSTGMKYTIGR